MEQPLGVSLALIKSQPMIRMYPSVAGLTNGNVFVAWDGNQAGSYDIYGRVFLPNGTALGSEFSINQITTNDQQYPSVAGLTNGNVFVAWDGNQAGNLDIYGRVFLPNGTALGSEFSINQITTNDQYNPSVAGLTNGNVFVAWEGNQAGSYDIYGRVFLPNGTALGSEFRINQITTNDQYQSVSWGFNQWQCVCGLEWLSSWHHMISMGVFFLI